MPEKLAERFGRDAPPMICPHCGTENESPVRFCRKCGRTLRKKELQGAITCRNHGNRLATTSCAQCGIRLCDTCAIDTGGIAFCRGCIEVTEPTESELLEKVAVVDLKSAERAGFVTRITAGAVDWFILIGEGLILAALFWMITGVLPLAGVFDGHMPIASWIYWTIIVVSVASYFVIFTAGGGQTLGKQAMSITVVCEDGTAPHLRQAWIGFAGSIVSFVVFGLGYLAILGDPQHQSWHDRWARTLVVSLE
ncbi:MAG TPA: RDD family protein [Capsulimonadaceae bacterium]|nr:RDD family protein [Capsulimonadaceae bacterium]